MSVKVSVVIPVYNPGRYIEPCVESLLNQNLPADEYEVIFVDDGSTDETPAYLDKLAGEHDHVRVFHIPNSGWPGKPRNVGVDEAVGEYVQFVDQDDYMAPDALRRLYEMGHRNGSDIVMGKVASNFRGVPHGVFKADREKCTIHDFNLIDSLTPHKMFRIAFLRENNIKYAEGKRRLEDQLYMVQTYFRAKVVSILGSYTCYFYSRRDDGKNAGTAKLVPSGYYGNLREVLDVVVSNTEPGPFRDGLLRRFYRVEMLGRISEPAMPNYDDEHRTNMINEISRLATDFMTDGVHDGLAVVQRVRSTLLRQDRREELVELARRCITTAGAVRLDDLQWQSGRIAVTLTAELVQGPDRTPVTVIRRGDRYFLDPEFYAGLLPGGETFEITREMASFKAEIGLRDRDTAVEWSCPGEFTSVIEEVVAAPDGDGTVCRVLIRGTGYLDPRKTKTRGPLAKGMWDVWIRVNGLGFAKRVRLGADRADQVDAQCLPALLGIPPQLTVPYYTDPGDNITLDVSRRSKKLGPEVTERGVKQVSGRGRWIELELPVATKPGTPAVPTTLVLHGATADSTYSVKANLLPFGDRVHVRARARIYDRDARAALAKRAWDIGLLLDGKTGPEVPIGRVHVSNAGRLMLAGDLPIAGKDVVGKTATIRRRNDINGAIRRFGAPIIRRLSPETKKKLRARAKSLGL